MREGMTDTICMYTPSADGGMARYAWELTGALAAHPRGGYRFELVCARDIEGQFLSDRYRVHPVLPAATSPQRLLRPAELGGEPDRLLPAAGAGFFEVAAVAAGRGRRPLSGVDPLACRTAHPPDQAAGQEGLLHRPQRRARTSTRRTCPRPSWTAGSARPAFNATGCSSTPSGWPTSWRGSSARTPRTRRSSVVPHGVWTVRELDSDPTLRAAAGLEAAAVLRVDPPQQGAGPAAPRGRAAARLRRHRRRRAERAGIFQGRSPAARPAAAKRPA